MLACLLAEIEGLNDKACFVRLYDQHCDIMYRVALSLLGDAGAAQDAVQESFLKIIKNFSKISALPHTEMTPYIVTIVENTAKDMLRKKNRQPDISAEEEWEPPAAETVESMTAHRRLVELILSMPESYRDILLMSCVEEQSSQEIAHRLGLTRGQVEGRLHRGRKLLREIVRKEGYEP